MWTKRKDILNYINNYLQDVTFEEIKQFGKELNLKVTKQEIQNWLFDVAKAEGVDMTGSNMTSTQNSSDLDQRMISKSVHGVAVEAQKQKYKLNEKDYDLYVRNLNIYKRKIRMLCDIIDILTTDGVDSSNVEKLIDISTNGSSVLTADLDRILKPLKTNYERAFKLKMYAEDFSSYLSDSSNLIARKIKTRVARSGLINFGNKPDDESIEATEKQRAKERERRDSVKKDVLARYEN